LLVCGVSPLYPQASVSPVLLSYFGSSPLPYGVDLHMLTKSHLQSTLARRLRTGSSSHDSMEVVRDTGGDSLVESSAVRPSPAPIISERCVAVRIGEAREKQAGSTRTSRQATAMPRCAQAGVCRSTMRSVSPARRPSPSRNTHLADMDSRGCPPSPVQQGLTRRSLQARPCPSRRQKPLSFGCGMDATDTFTSSPVVHVDPA
jgi:hypothetical protein